MSNVCLLRIVNISFAERKLLYLERKPRQLKPVLMRVLYLFELEFGNVCFCGGRKTGEQGRKTLGARTKPNNKIKLEYDAGHGNRTRATLVGGECSHHYAIPVPLVVADFGGVSGVRPLPSVL